MQFGDGRTRFDLVSLIGDGYIPGTSSLSGSDLLLPCSALAQLSGSEPQNHFPNKAGEHRHVFTAPMPNEAKRKKPPAQQSNLCQTQSLAFKHTYPTSEVDSELRGVGIVIAEQLTAAKKQLKQRVHVMSRLSLKPQNAS